MKVDEDAARIDYHAYKSTANNLIVLIYIYWPFKTLSKSSRKRQEASVILFKTEHCYATIYLTIIPRARMGSESIAHEAEGRMGY